MLDMCYLCNAEVNGLRPFWTKGKCVGVFVCLTATRLRAVFPTVVRKGRSYGGILQVDLVLL